MAVRDAGSIIRELRLATGMSQWDFCDGICSVQTLSNIENGKQAISPIVFQSLTEKCGEMINPYPQFVSLDDFQCYMAVSNVDFYIDSWQFSIALDELRKIEESYFAENKLYYQQWLMYHAYILELSGHEDYAARKELLLHALSITGCDDINKISPKRMLLSVETRLLIMLGEVCILQNDQTNSSRILAIVEKQFPVSERNTGGRFPHGAVELLRQHYLLNFDPQKASVEGAYEDYHNAVNSFISVPTLRACFAYAAALYINGHYVDAILVGTKMYGKDMICKRKQFGSFILHVPETKFYIGNRSVKEIEPDYLVDNICEYNAEEILDLCYRLDHREEQK